MLESAQLLGISFEYFHSWYLSALGYIFHELTAEQQVSLIARLILRVPFFRLLFAIEDETDDLSSIREIRFSKKQRKIIHSWFIVCRNEIAKSNKSLWIRDVFFSRYLTVNSWSVSKISFVWEKIPIKSTDEIIEDAYNRLIAKTYWNDEDTNIACYCNAVDERNCCFPDEYEITNEIFYRELCVEDYIYGPTDGYIHNHIEYSQADFFESEDDVYDNEFVIYYNGDDYVCPSCQSEDIISLDAGIAYCYNCNKSWHYRPLSNIPIGGAPTKEEIERILSNCCFVDEDVVSDSSIDNNKQDTSKEKKTNTIRESNLEKAKELVPDEKYRVVKTYLNCQTYQGLLIDNHNGIAKLINTDKLIVFERNGLLVVAGNMCYLLSMTMSVFRVNYVFKTLRGNWALGRAFINASKGSDLYGLVHTKELIEIAQSMAFGDTTVLYNGMLFLSDGKWAKRNRILSASSLVNDNETTVVKTEGNSKQNTSIIATSKKKKVEKREKSRKMSLEEKIIEVIKRNRRMKTVDIAAKLGCSISKINHCLYGSLKNKLYYDDSYHWCIKQT